MHFHHAHDADPCERDHGWPDYVHAIIATINRGVATVSADQDKIVELAQGMNDVLSAIEAEVANLKAQPQAEALDFSPLEAALSRGQADVPAPAPAPAAEPTPTPAPVDPSVPAPADVPAPAVQPADPNLPSI